MSDGVARNVEAVLGVYYFVAVPWLALKQTFAMDWGRDVSVGQAECSISLAVGSPRAAERPLSQFGRLNTTLG